MLIEGSLETYTNTLSKISLVWIRLSFEKVPLNNKVEQNTSYSNQN